MLKTTPKRRVLYVRRSLPVFLAVFGVFSLLFANVHSPKTAYATAASTVNFQARLQTASGAIVPDGDYNVEFKLYSAPSGGSALWTEDYTHTSGAGGTEARLTVKDGYLSTALGSITAFPGTIDWSQQLYLTMNIGGTGTSASWDGEMNPRLALTASTYAFQAGSAAQAGELSNVTGSNTSTLTFQGSSSGTQNFVIQDQGAGGTYDLLTTQAANNSFIQLQTGTPSPQTGQLDISGAATVGSVVTGSLDTGSSASISIGSTHASSISLGNTTSNIATTINGTAVVKPTSGNDSTTAFQVQNASGVNVLNADTVNSRVSVDAGYTAMTTPTGLSVGTATSGGSLTASTTYYYKVTAIDSLGGETAASSEANGATTSPNKTLPVTWTAVTGASGYKVYRATTTGSEVYLTTVLTNSFTDSGSITAGSATPPSTTTAYTSSNNSSALGQVTIGGNGTPTGQLYVSGEVPAGATGSAVTGSNPTEITVQGNYAYVVNHGANTMQVFDISNPAVPQAIASVSTGSGPQDIAVQGAYAYVTNFNNSGSTIQVFNISNPHSPTSVATVQDGFQMSPYGIKVQGNYLYVISNSGSAIQIYNITNPAAPTFVSSASASGGARDVFVQGRYAYVTNRSANNLQIFNVSNPASPSSVGTVSGGTAPQDVYVQGRYAYMTNVTGNTLQIIDVSNPATPVSVSTVSTGSGGPMDVYVQGRYAYVTNNTSGTMQVFDVSNPAAPFSVGTVSTGSGPWGITVSGGYAYVVNNTASTLQTFNLGGEYAQQLQAGGIQTGTLQVGGSTAIGGDLALQGGLTVGGNVQFSNGLGVTGNTTLQGTLSIAGGVQGGAVISGLSTPGTPTVTAEGTTGATNYSYQIAAVSASGGTTPASTAGSTASGNATLTTSNYNYVTWSAIAGAISYNVYRCTGSSCSGEQLLANVSGTTYDDTAAGSPSGNAPTVDTSGKLTVNGAATFTDDTNSTSAFLVQNSSSASILDVDTSNSRVGILTSTPTNYTLSFGSGGARSIGVDDNTSAAGNSLTINAGATTVATDAGGDLNLNAGQGNTTGTGGNATLQGGTGGATGNGGAVTVKGGTGGSTSGTGGAATLQGGSARGAFAGGTATVQGGSAFATGGSNGGSVAITGAAGSTNSTGGAGGGITITGGNAGGSGNNAGGSIILQAGLATGSGAIGGVTVENAANSTTAFQIQNSSGSTFFNADSTNQIISTKDLNVGSASNISGAGRIFSDGFESGALNQYTSVSGNAAIDSTTVRNGKYAAKFTPSGSAAYVRTPISVGSTIVLRGYVYVTSQTTSNEHLMALCTDSACTPNVGSTAGEFMLYRDITNGKLAFFNGPSNSGVDTSAVLTTGAWHEIEEDITIGSGSSGASTVYLDGVSVQSFPSSNTGTTNPTYLNIGEDSSGRTSVMAFDDVVVDTVRPGDSSSLNVNDSLHVGGSASFGSNVLVQTAYNSTNAFQVQNAAGNTLLGVDTSGANVNIGSTGSSSVNSTVNIANSSAGVQTVNLGSTNSTSQTLIQGGTGSSALQLQVGSGGTIGVGNNGVANTINVGQTGTGAVTQTINIGNGGSGSTSNVTLGNVNAGTTTIQGAGGITISNNTTVASGKTLTVTSNEIVGTLSGTTLTVGSNNVPNAKLNVNTGSTVALRSYQAGSFDVGQFATTGAGVGTATTNNTTSLVGSSTLFTQYFQIGDAIQVGSQLRTVATITDDTHLTVSSAFTTSTGGQAYSRGVLGAGTLTTNGTAAIVGSGTSFLTTFQIGDSIMINGESTVGSIASITDNTHLTLFANAGTSASSLTYARYGYDRLDIKANGNIGIGTNSSTVALQIQPTGVGQGGLLVQAANGQTADLLAVQDSGSNVLLNVAGSSDTVNVGYTGSGSVNSTVNIGSASGGVQTVTVGSTSSTSSTTIQGGSAAGAISIQAASSGTINVGTTNGNLVNFGSSTQLHPTQVNIVNTNSSNRALIIQGASGQSVDLFDLYTNGGSFVSGYDVNGNEFLNGYVQTGTTSAAGVYKLKDGTANSYNISLTSAALANSYTLTLPTTGASSSGQCLQSGSGSTTSSTPLTFGSCGSAGVSTLGAVDGAGSANANGATISGSTLYLNSADGTHPGALNATTQTIGGAKTFSALITGNAGATINGAAVQINASSNNNTSINTGTSTGTITIGNTSAGAIGVEGGASGTTIDDTGGSLTLSTTTSGTLAISSAAALNLSSGGANNIALTTNNASAGTVIKSATNSVTAFQIQNSNGTTGVLLNADTTNSRISIGNIGTATGQLYVAGSVATSVLGTGSSAGGHVTDIKVVGNYAYAITASGTLQLDVYDVSNPASPSLDGSAAYSPSTNTGNYLAVAGKYAYVSEATTTNQIQVFDISNPHSPTSVGTITTASAPQGLYAQGRYLYAVVGNNLQAFDISNPAVPVSLSTTAAGSGPQDVFVQGKYAYVTDYSTAGFKVFDISNPASPSNTGTLTTGLSKPYNVFVQGRYAYITNNNTGSTPAQTMQVIDVSNPASPSLTGTSAVLGTNPAGIYVQGRYAYVTTFNGNTLATLDVSNPASPTVQGTALGLGSNNPANLVVQGRYAYVADGGANQFQVVDLGGEYAQQLQAGGTETGTLQVDNNANVSGDANIAGGLTVGGTSNLNGDTSISGKLGITSSSSSALQVQNNTGNSILNVDASTGGAVTITNNGSTSSPAITSVNTWNNRSATGLSSLTVSPSTIGDMMIVAVNLGAGGNTVTGISGGGVTNWQQVATYPAENYYIYEGRITSTGSTSIALTYASSQTIFTEIAAQEFSSAYGASTSWNAVASNTIPNSSASSITYPNVTTTAANQLYWGYGYTNSTATTTTCTSGFTCYVTSPGGDGVIYKSNTAASTLYGPSQSTSGSATSFAIATIISASPIAGSALNVNGSTLVSASSTTAFQVQNSLGYNTFGVDTTDGWIGLGTANHVNGAMVLNNSSNSNTITIQSGATSSSYTITLPTALGTTGQCLSDTTGTGALGWTSCGGGGGPLAISEVNGWGNSSTSSSANGSVSTVSPTNVGDILVAYVAVEAGDDFSTGVSGGCVGSWSRVANDDPSGAYGVDMWMGQITSTTCGTKTVTASFNATATSGYDLWVQEFTATGVASSTIWSVINANSNYHATSTSSVTIQSLTSGSTSNEMYTGYAFTDFTSVTGTYSGFTEQLTHDNNITAWGTNLLPSTTYAPTSTQGSSGWYSTIAAILSATSGGGGAGAYINNSTTTQSGNLNVQAATSGSVAATLQANASGSGDILDLKNGSGANVATFGSTGDVSLTSAETTGTALALTADSVTTGKGVDTSFDGLTTGTGVNIASTSALQTAGSLLNVSDTATLTTNGGSYSGQLVNVSRSLTANVATGGEAISHSVTPVKGTGTTNANTTTFAAANVGDIIFVSVLEAASSGTYSSCSVSNISYASVTTWNRISTANDSTNHDHMEVWYGVATSTTTHAVTLSSVTGCTPTFTEISADSFHAAGSPTWNIVNSAHNTFAGNSAGDDNYPSLTATAVNQYYWGESDPQGTASGGNNCTAATSGFTCTSISSTTGVVRSNSALTNGVAYAPAWAAGQPANDYSNNWGVLFEADVAGSGAANVQSSVASFSNNCTNTGSTTCSDSSSVISINQQYSGATGSVLNVQNSGSGNTLQLQNSSGATVMSVGSAGATLIQTTTNSTSALNVENAAGTSLVNVDTTNTAVNLGAGGTLNPFGYTTIGGTGGSGYTNSVINLFKYTATYTGTISSLTVYVENIDSTSKGYRVGIYNDSSGTPTTVLGTSAQATLGVAAGWNTASLISPVSVTAGHVYWLAYVSSTSDTGKNDVVGDASGSGVYAYADETPANIYTTGFTTWTGEDGDLAVNKSMYANYSSSGYGLSLGANGALTAAGPATFESLTNSTTAFQIQNNAGVNLFTADTTNERLYIGPTAGDTTGAILVLGNKTNAGDPTGVAGAMYYNSNMNEFRCYTNAWHPCGSPPIDQSYDMTDDFMSGGTTPSPGSPTIGSYSAGSLPWQFIAITGGSTGTCGSLAYNGLSGGSGSGPGVSATHPGVLALTANSIATGGCRLKLGVTSALTAGPMVVGAGEDIKASAAISSASANGMLTRVGLDTSPASSSRVTNAGVWWEADPTNNSHWEYCYATGSVATCAASSVTIAANTLVSLEIQVNSSSSVTFIINHGTPTVLTGITLGAATNVSPNILCTNSGSGTTGGACFYDYYQLRGDTAAVR